MGPLNGVKVLDFTHGVAGPVATMLLADLGADVIKIEKPGRGDASRYMNVSGRFTADIPRSGGDYYLAINRNKRAVALDLQREEGRDIALRLSEWADVVVQNFRPGVMDRLGLGYAAISPRNPGAIYASLSAYGTNGPLAHQPGMDVAVQARSGVMSITGYPGGDPVKPGASLADFSGGVHLAVGILGALYHRLQSGHGQEINVSLLDSTMSMLGNYSVAVMDGGAEIQPMGSGHPQLVPFQAFRTQDGYIVIATGTNKLFRELCQVLGVHALADDPKFRTNPLRVQNRQELVDILTRVTERRPTAEWIRTFEESEIPCSPVNDMRTAFADEQLRANGMIVEVEHSVLGSIHLLGVPYHYTETECQIYRTPPLLGEHTRDVLGGILNMDAAALDELEAAGAIGVPGTGEA